MLSSNKSSDIYHDIYDFSLFPVSLGDILTWGVKSALRAAAAGRKKVHVHLIIDMQKSGHSPFQASSYSIDLFVVEVLPAFYSHPLFSGLSVYRSRDDFRSTFSKIANGDEISLDLYSEHESLFQDRKNYDRLGAYFRKNCSDHDEINECFRKTGTFPKIEFLQDCLLDWKALQNQFSTGTLWVAMQFRLRKLDSGMPVAEEGFKRDASFLTWYEFISEASKRCPSVRFILLGRLQEKPLELLRMPNVVTLRTLGMNLGHEITALLHSDLYMGSPSGFAQAAHFSDIPYDVFNCTDAGCVHYGIPFGARQLPIAGPRQRLHYGEEEVEALMDCLNEALVKTHKEHVLPDTFETNRAGSTDRFFISDAQSNVELTNLFSNRLKPLALAVERGEYPEADRELKKMAETFPRFMHQWPEFGWLSGIVDFLLQGPEGAHQTKEDWETRRNEHLAQISHYLHPNRLIRRSGWYLNNLYSSEGFRCDGWCEKRTKLVFAPSNRGDFLIIQIGRVSGGEATWLSARINRQKVVPFVLLNEHAILEIPVLDLSIPTEVVLEADRAFKVKPEDEKENSYQIEGAALVSKQPAAQTFYLADKRDPREKVVSGIYHNGAVGSVARIRIDNPFPDDTEIMIRVIGRIPSRSLRKGQCFRIQVNQDETHEAFLTGKRFEAVIPCPGRPRHLAILFQFWNRNEPETIARENRAIIKSIHIVPATGQSADIKTGYRSMIDYLFNSLKSRVSKKYPKPV